MADPVSLTLGIAPIFVTAVKGLTLLSSKLTIFRHYSNEIEQVRKKLRIQGDSFRDELHLLLLEVLDQKIVITMMSNQDHPQWQAKELESKLRSYLGSKYASFEETMNEVRETIENLLQKISAFSQSETVVSLSKSTRDAIRIAFKKNDYIESIQNLKESNAELRRIRETVGKLQKCYMKTDCLSLPSAYEIIRNMSSFLYDLLLNGSSSCNTAMNTDHYAKLMLSSTDETDPNINLFFEHRLLIKSSGGNLPPHEISQQQHDRVVLPICASFKDNSYLSPLVLSPQSSRIPQTRHLHDTISKPETNGSGTIRIGRDEDEGEDLTNTGVKCKELMVRSKVCSGSPPQSLGYVNIRKNQKLVLYPGLQGLLARCDLFNIRETTPLLDFLKTPAYDVITDVDRIKLGIILVKSMLKYNSTPWWPQELTLGQVHVLLEGNDDLSSSLSTLHISIQLGGFPPTTEGTSSASPDEEKYQYNFLSPASIEDAMENHGIRNLTLYGLGVVLLQIGLWEDIPWEDHIQVRRKVARLSWLGKRYRDATKKLIYCDFGLATEELRDRNLQSAIFRDVIGDLESIVDMLTSPGR